MRSLRLLQHLLVFHAVSGWNPLTSCAALENRCPDADSDATSLLQLETDLEINLVTDRRHVENRHQVKDVAPFVSRVDADAPDEVAHSSGSCPATCSGRTCDHWPDVACERLEHSYGCDCGGCICRVGSHAQVAQAAAAGVAGIVGGLRGSTPPADPHGLPGWSGDLLQAADLIQACGDNYDSLASKKAQSLDNSKLMGKWKEVASRNIPFLADSCKCSTWDLRAMDDQGAYTVNFECQNEAWWSFLSPRVRIPSTGAVEWAGPPGKLTQVLFGKLQMPYWVLEYWGDYEQALVYRCVQVGPFKQEFIHFLSRDAVVPDNIRVDMAQYADGVGLNMSLVRPVPMDSCSAPAPEVHGDVPDASRIGRLQVPPTSVLPTNCTGDDGNPMDCFEAANSTDNYSSEEVPSTSQSPGSKICRDSAGEATDAEGFGCEAYVDLPGNCGGDDDADFTASVMCCACQGLCEDSAGNAVDAEGFGCNAYIGLPSNCGGADDADFTASVMCCACEGLCEDSAGDAVDAEGFGCEAYSGLPGNCGGDDDADFTAKDMCCACKGLLGKHTTRSQGGLVAEHTTTSNPPSPVPARSHNPSSGPKTCQDSAGEALDAEGFGCEVYVGLPQNCGADDDADFTASAMCCACEGLCKDNAGDAVDAEGFGCDAYVGLHPNCGGDDDADFTASAMCCSCQGLCQDSAGNAKDAEGFGCDAYLGLPSNCGGADDADFTASVMCCACQGLCQDSAGTAKDAEGFGCEAYAGLNGNCGGDDDADFTAKDMCCACKGLLGKHTTKSQGGLVAEHTTTSNPQGSGLWMSQPPRRGPEICRDTAGDAVDAEGYGCDDYTSMPQYCRGDDDDADFTASAMCCACKGDREATPPRLQPPPRSGASKQALAAELAAEIAIAGCAILGGGKWFTDPHGTLFQVKQDNCNITFALSTDKGVHFEKSGVVRGTKVLVEPPFPEGQVVDGNVEFHNGARWERKW